MISLVLNRVRQGANADLGDERRVQVYLDAESGKTSLNIVNGASIYLEKVT